MNEDPYAVDARFYDLIHDARSREDIGLWMSFAHRTDMPVLEVGTGTGRIAVELALAGYEVTAIDPSAAMVERARARAEDRAAELTLVQGRAQELALPAEGFGLVLVPADVFLYCEDANEQESLLASLRKLLSYNGVLALDLPGPMQWPDPATNGQPMLAAAEPSAEGHLRVWHVHEDDLAAQTRLLEVSYEVDEPDGSVRRWRSEHRLLYVFPREAAFMLERSGLALADVYGDYDLGPLTNDSERMILIARRTGA